MTATAQRVPPHNLDAERSLLGAMLISTVAVGVAAAALSADDFYKPAHGHIYEAVVALYATGEPVDAITVADQLERTGLLAAIGGANTLNDVIGATGSTSNVERYADIIADLAKQRSLIGIASEIAELGYEPSTDVANVIDQAEQMVYRLTDSSTTTNARPAGEVAHEWVTGLQEAWEAGGHTRGVPTGFVELDTLLLGLQPGQLVVAAGRPGMGKTAFGSDVARNVASLGHPVLLVSLEMGNDEVMNRMVAADGRVPLQRIRDTKLIPDHWTRISEAVGRITQMPLEIFDDSHANLVTIRSQARRVASRYGRLGLIVVDYVQLVDPIGKHHNREGEVAEVARGLKKLARELGVPVLALAQLNRGLEQRADKRPMLSDLRESGEIENAADVVAFLYRDDYYRPDSPDRGMAEVIVAKQRSGPTGTARLAWVSYFTTFKNMARTD